jgi:hypothetical protein
LACREHTRDHRVGGEKDDMRERREGFLSRQARASAYCVVYGAAYAALCFAVSVRHSVSFIHIIENALAGAIAGAAGGFVASIVRNVTGRRLGWCLAGAVGGLTLGLVLMHCLASSVTDWYPDSFWELLYPFWSVLQTSVLIGAGLGLALDLGLWTGKSILPGAQRVAATAYPVSLPEAVETLLDSSEVIPSAAPEGRGDEAVPME